MARAQLLARALLAALIEGLQRRGPVAHVDLALLFGLGAGLTIVAARRARLRIG